jgi:hypothetical protein
MNALKTAFISIFISLLLGPLVIVLEFFFYDLLVNKQPGGPTLLFYPVFVLFGSALAVPLGAMYGLTLYFINTFGSHSLLTIFRKYSNFAGGIIAASCAIGFIGLLNYFHTLSGKIFSDENIHMIFLPSLVCGMVIPHFVPMRKLVSSKNA